MKKIACLVMSIIMLLAMCANGFAAEFSDVPQGHWAHDVIDELSDMGVINGIGNGLYDPDGVLTRAQFIKLLVCATEDYDENTEYPQVFGDTAADAWYTPYVTCGVFSGIVENTTGVFEPDGAMSRGEAVVWMINSLGIETDAECEFYDVTDSVQKRAVGNAVRLGLITGYEDATFRPDDTLKRSEAAALISRLMKYREETFRVRPDAANEVVFKESVKYTDMSGNTIADIDNAKKTITFSESDEVVAGLEKGDILYIEESGELAGGLLAKITNVKKSGEKVTLTCQMPEIEDVIDSMDISVVVGVRPEHFNSGNVTGIYPSPESAENGFEFDADVEGGVSGDVEKGKLVWSIYGSATESANIHYETESYKKKEGLYAALDMNLNVLVDMRLDGKNLDTNVSAFANVDTDVTVVGGYKNGAEREIALEMPSGEIPLAGPIKIEVTPYIVMRASGEIEVEASATISNSTGFSYNELTGFDKWNDPMIQVHAEAKAAGEVEIGPRVEVELQIDCGEDLFLGDIGLLEVEADMGAGINGEVDVEENVDVSLEGVNHESSYNTPDENGVLHDCYVCFKGEVYDYYQFSAGLADELNEWLEEEFGFEVKFESEKFKVPLFPWHYSTGGSDWIGPEFELKACEHKKYRTTVTVTDSETKEAVEGAYVFLSNNENAVTDENGKAEFFLKKDQYAVGVTHEDYEDKYESFYVADKAKEIRIDINSTRLTQEEIENLVVAYFTEQYPANGEYRVFSSETSEKNGYYSICVRFASFAPNASANTLVEFVKVDKATCEMFINNRFVCDLNG